MFFTNFSSYSAFPPLSQEISTTWIKDQSNNDTHRKIIHFKGNLNSSGEFTCQNGDYFEGQFFWISGGPFRSLDQAPGKWMFHCRSMEKWPYGRNC